MSSPDPDRQCLSLIRLVHVSILISLLWKLRFFLYLLNLHTQYPVEDNFFPVWLQSERTLVVAYCMATVCAVAVLLLRSQGVLLAASAGSLLALTVTILHQNSFNDVTFLCCWWASLWCFWLMTRLKESFESIYPRAAWLSHLILSLIFLGGTIGKLTPGYWSGEVLFEIYFRDRDYWTYNWLRNTLDAEALRSAAMWHSRIVVISEGICMFLWLMPRKVASAIAILVLCGIALTNNVLLFSVVTSLIGLALVGLHEPNRKPVGATDRQVHFRGT